MLARTLGVLLGLFFLVIGASKLMMVEGWVWRFTDWGLPPPMLIVVGAVEFTGGLLLMLRTVRSLAAALLVPVMVGAVFVHGVNGELVIALLPASLAAVLLWVAWRSLPFRLPIDYFGKDGSEPQHEERPPEQWVA